jgi:hypothetical protein
MEFYIRKNATLPILKMRAVNDGRGSYKDFISFNDTINFRDLTKIYEKINVKKEDYSVLKNIFCETKKNNATFKYDCLPIYRDVLIFRKKSKITGFIKICFSCNHYNLIVNDSAKKHNFENNIFLDKILRNVRK